MNPTELLTDQYKFLTDGQIVMSPVKTHHQSRSDRDKWIKNRENRFIRKYGADDGLKILHMTAPK